MRRSSFVRTLLGLLAAPFVKVPEIAGENGALPVAPADGPDFSSDWSNATGTVTVDGQVVNTDHLHTDRWYHVEYAFEYDRPPFVVRITDSAGRVVYPVPLLPARENRVR